MILQIKTRTNSFNYQLPLNDIDKQRINMLEDEVLEIYIDNEIIISANSCILLKENITRLEELTDSFINLKKIIKLFGADVLLSRFPSINRNGIILDIFETLSIEEIKKLRLIYRYDDTLLNIIIDSCRKHNDFDILVKFMNNNNIAERDVKLYNKCFNRLSEEEKDILAKALIKNLIFKSHEIKKLLLYINNKNIDIIEQELLNNIEYIKKLVNDKDQLILCSKYNKLCQSMLQYKPKSFILKTNFNKDNIDYYGKVFNINLYKNMDDYNKGLSEIILNIMFNSNLSDASKQLLIYENLTLIVYNNSNNINKIKDTIILIISLVSSKPNFFLLEKEVINYKELSDETFEIFIDIVTRTIFSYGNKRCKSTIIEHGMNCFKSYNSNIDISKIITNIIPEFKNIKKLQMELLLKNK